MSLSHKTHSARTLISDPITVILIKLIIGDSQFDIFWPITVIVTSYIKVYQPTPSPPPAHRDKTMTGPRGLGMDHLAAETYEYPYTNNRTLC